MYRDRPIGDRLFEFRKDNQLTLRECQELCGINFRMLARIEKGYVCQPRKETCDKIIKMFDEQEFLNQEIDEEYLKGYSIGELVERIKTLEQQLAEVEGKMKPLLEKMIDN